MNRILQSLAKAAGLTAAVLTLTLMLAAAPTLAGGDPGGPPESPATLTLDAFTLTHDKSVVFAGTLTCLQAADVTIDMRVQQGPEAHFVSVFQQATVQCAPGIAYPIDLVFDPVHPALFHPGALVVGIELEGWTVPDEQGEGTYFTQFGIVDVKVAF
jgi:hypothetical protein